MSNTKKYHVVLTAKTPLLMHKDNIEFTENVTKWRKDPQNKRISVAGDDRSPAWTWIGYCYASAVYHKLILHSDNIMTMLREAGAKMPTGKGKATFKSITQCGFQLCDEGFNFYNNGNEIGTDWMNDLIDDNEFDHHLEAVKQHGFSLNLKRAKIGSGARASKHIRVRPQFDSWSAEGDILVVDPSITGLTGEIVQRLFSLAGEIIGVGDWRPSCASSGPFGRFNAKVEEIEQ